MTFTEAYIQYYPFVYKVCKHMLHDHTTAEDTAQDTLYKLLRHWDKLDEKDSLYAWLKTAARSTAIDILRKQNKEVLFAEVYPTECSEEDPGALLMEEAKEVVRTFSPMYQEIFYLSFICGYTGPQIATLLSLPLPTVKTRIRTCTQKLKAALA